MLTEVEAIPDKHEVFSSKEGSERKQEEWRQTVQNEGDPRTILLLQNGAT